MGLEWMAFTRAHQFPPPDDLASSGALAVLAKPVRMEQLYAALYDAGSPPT
jgi:hypothetical protein